jgi:hypothetical protein
MIAAVDGNIVITTIYAVTLNNAPGTGTVGTIYVTYGQVTPTVAPTPTRAGYTFGGYFDVTGGAGTQYIDSNGHGIKAWDKGNATLYAHWIIIPPSGKDYYITSSSDARTSISPEGTITVSAGSNQTFRFSADPGYAIFAVTVDGTPLSQAQIAQGSYTFYNVNANHTINVVSRELRTDITLTIVIVEGKGSAEYSTDGGTSFKKYTGVTSIPELCNLVVRAYAADGYTFVKWVDGDDEQFVYEMPFYDVKSHIYLELYFSEDDSDNSLLLWAAGLLLLLLLLLLLFLLFYRKKYDVIKVEGANIIGNEKVRRKSKYTFTIEGGYAGMVVYRVGDEGEWLPLVPNENGEYIIPRGQITGNVTIECR